MDQVAVRARPRYRYRWVKTIAEYSSRLPPGVGTLWPSIGLLMTWNPPSGSRAAAGSCTRRSSSPSGSGHGGEREPRLDPCAAHEKINHARGAVARGAGGGGAHGRRVHVLVDGTAAPARSAGNPTGPAFPSSGTIDLTVTPTAVRPTAPSCRWVSRSRRCAARGQAGQCPGSGGYRGGDPHRVAGPVARGRQRAQRPGRVPRDPRRQRGPEVDRRVRPPPRGGDAARSRPTRTAR